MAFAGSPHCDSLVQWDFKGPAWKPCSPRWNSQTTIASRHFLAFSTHADFGSFHGSWNQNPGHASLVVSTKFNNNHAAPRQTHHSRCVLWFFVVMLTYLAGCQAFVQEAQDTATLHGTKQLTRAALEAPQVALSWRKQWLTWAFRRQSCQAALEHLLPLFRRNSLRTHCSGSVQQLQLATVVFMHVMMAEHALTSVWTALESLARVNMSEKNPKSTMRGNFAYAQSSSGTFSEQTACWSQENQACHSGLSTLHGFLGHDAGHGTQTATLSRRLSCKCSGSA